MHERSRRVPVNLLTLIPAYLGQRLHEARAGRGKVPPFGHAVERPRDMEVIATYHRLHAKGGAVDDRTWEDLSMDRLFAQVDRTFSMPGRQMLYHQLRTPEPNLGILAGRTLEQDVWSRSGELRAALVPILARLENAGAGDAAAFLAHPIPSRPRGAWVFPMLSGLCLAAVAGAFFRGGGWILVLLALAVINVVVSEFATPRLTPWFQGFRSLAALLDVGARLAALEAPATLPVFAGLRAQMPSLAAARRCLPGGLVADRRLMPESSQLVLGWLNMLFLVDILLYLRALPVLEGHRTGLLRLFEQIGELDAAVSAASWRSGLDGACVPVLTGELRVQAEDLRHPLLDRPVGNDVSLADRSAVVTGSNMAGKTTFIKTVAVNVLLARTLHVALARRAVLPAVPVLTAIRREELSLDGQSYFFGEVARLGDFLALPAQEGPRLLAVDEIYRGTNTLERIAASTAVLDHLARTHLVLVTTHDLELASNLRGSFDSFHFSEVIEDGVYGFDYRLRPGPATGRNAIRLLGLSGYPEAVVRHAEALAARD